MKPTVIILAAQAVIAAAAAAEPWTLERALEHAMTNSPDARIALHRVTAAQAGLEQARAAFWPTLQLQSSYSRTDNPMQVFGSALNQRAFTPGLDFNNVPDADNLNVRGLVTMPLYAGGGITAGRDAAKAHSEAARHSASAIQNQLAFEVARAFHGVAKTREFIRATKAAINSLEESLGIARKRFDAGTILKIELLDIEVRLAQAREDFVRAENAAVLSEHVLRNLLGVETGEFSVLTAPARQELPDSGLFGSRPELLAAASREQAADAEVRRAESGFRPRLNAFGSVDYDHGWKFDGSGESYTAGVFLQWDIWDGRRTRAKVNGARAELEAAREEERKTRLSIDLQTEQARLALRDATARLDVTDKIITQAEESVVLTRRRFAQGLALATQLIDSETALLAARVRRAEAEGDQQIAIAALRHALGLPQIDSTRKDSR